MEWGEENGGKEKTNEPSEITKFVKYIVYGGPYVTLPLIKKKKKKNAFYTLNTKSC
jgi:hypothetical protein